ANYGQALLPSGFAVSNESIVGTNDLQLNPIVTCNPIANLQPHQFVNGACFGLPSAGHYGPTVLPAYYGPWFFNSDLGLFKNFQIRESMKVQFRLDGYNFLNHPLWSFNGTNLSLVYNSAGQQTSTNFGYTTEKQGNRIVQLAVKFFF
ncbi:MAG TPA: hypothetical protein VG345_02185, partial [Bryobacteraceae bacterium]|nr:hypothetical protein [Bryobacteraceae bacterium]